MKYDVRIRSMFQSSELFEHKGNFQFIGFRGDFKFEKSHIKQFLKNFFDSLHHDSLGKWKSVLGKPHQSDIYKDEMATGLRLKLMDHIIRNGKTIFEDLFDRKYETKCENEYNDYCTVTDKDPTKK